MEIIDTYVYVYTHTHTLQNIKGLENSGIPWWSSGQHSALSLWDLGSILDWGTKIPQDAWHAPLPSPIKSSVTQPSGEGNGTPLQYSCLENPMDGGAWWAAVHGVMKSQTLTERLHFHFSLSCIGEGNGNPLQCSCQENPRDGGAWWGAVYGVAQSRTTEVTQQQPQQQPNLLQLASVNNLLYSFTIHFKEPLSSSPSLSVFPPTLSLAITQCGLFLTCFSLSGQREHVLNHYSPEASSVMAVWDSILEMNYNYSSLYSSQHTATHNTRHLCSIEVKTEGKPYIISICKTFHSFHCPCPQKSKYADCYRLFGDSGDED